MASPKKPAEDVEKTQRLYDKLKEVRASTTVSLKPTPLLKESIRVLDGTEQEFKLRYYQVQGVYHMLVVPRMILGDDTGLGKCQPLTTLLRTSQGLAPLGDLRPLGLDPKTAQEGFYDLDRPVAVWTGRRMTSVRRFYWSGIKPTLRATTRNGFRVEGSLVHPVLVRRDGREQFVQMPDLQEGNFICVDRAATVDFPADPIIPFDAGNAHFNTKLYSYPDRLTPDLATLLGYIVSEGNRTPHGVVVTQWVSLNPEPHAEIRRLFLSIFGWAGNEADVLRDARIAVSSVGIKQFLAACGVGEELSREKFIPPCVMRGSKASVRGFLSAMIEAEGSVAEGGVEFTSSSERLAREVQLLLLMFGVVGTLSPKRIPDNPHTYWRLTFFGNDARRFVQEIGFRSERKSRALSESLSDKPNPNKDVVPEAKGLVAALHSRIAEAVARTGANASRKGSGMKQFGTTFWNTLMHVAHSRRDPTYIWLEAHLLRVSTELGLTGTPEHKAVEEVVRRRYFYDPIVRIESVGEQYLADIEVDDPDHCFVADGVVSHNTIETIATLCYLWQKEPNNKVIVIAPKSAIRQWASEISRFTNGVRPIIAGDNPKKGESPVEARERTYKEWLEAPPDEKVVLIMNYAVLVRDWNHGGFQPPEQSGKLKKQPVIPGLLDGITAKVGVTNLTVVLDECTAFKSDNTKTWEIVRFLSDRSRRVYGLTATLLKNRLFEGYCIYKAIKPGVFTTKKAFYDAYCYVELKKLGNARVPIIKGYKNLDGFRATIDPYYLGRKKHTVAKELPVLTTREVGFELSGAEERKYQEALNGIIELGDGEVKDFEEHKALTSLIYCQMIVNSLSMLKFAEGDEVAAGFAWDEDTHKVGNLSSKEQALLDLITGELDDEKVIIYTRFASLVPRLQAILQREGVKSEAITGKVNDKKRKAAQDAFQNLESDTSVIFITAAGSEAINLQMAKAMIFFDMPWSWGEYLQAIGRMIRIGSPNAGVLAFHLLARRPDQEDSKTIDHHVLKMLRTKKNVIDKVLGEGAVGALKFDKSGSSVQDLIRALQGKKGAA